MDNRQISNCYKYDNKKTPIDATVTNVLFTIHVTVSYALPYVTHFLLNVVTEPLGEIIRRQM